MMHSVSDQTAVVLRFLRVFALLMLGSGVGCGAVSPQPGQVSASHSILFEGFVLKANKALVVKVDGEVVATTTSDSTATLHCNVNGIVFDLYHYNVVAWVPSGTHTVKVHRQGNGNDCAPQVDLQCAANILQQGGDFCYAAVACTGIGTSLCSYQITVTAS